MCDVSSLLGSSNHNQRVQAVAQQQQQAAQAQILQKQQDDLYKQQLDAQNAQNAAQAKQAADADAAAKAAAQQAQQKADQQKANIAANNGALDQNFGQFNDDYYNGLVKAYAGANDPAVQQASGKARDQLVAALSGRGLSGSSVAADELANFDQTTNQQLSNISNQGQNNANTLKSSVAQARSSLGQLAATGEDPNTFAASALANSTALAKSGTSQAGIPSPSVTPVAGSTSTPIAGLFGSLVAPFQTAAASSASALQVPQNGVQASNPNAQGSSYTTS